MLRVQCSGEDGCEQRNCVAVSETCSVRPLEDGVVENEQKMSQALADSLLCSCQWPSSTLETMPHLQMTVKEDAASHIEYGARFLFDAYGKVPMFEPAHVLAKCIQTFSMANS